MIESYVGASTAAAIQAARQRAKATAGVIRFVDTYTAWEVNRPAGWSDGSTVEAKAQVETGVGRLIEQGAGGPQGGETVIHVESPYRFQTYAFDPDTLIASGIATGNLLVVNGARLFRVDAIKRSDSDNPLMNVYVTELFSTPMPGGG